MHSVRWHVAYEPGPRNLEEMMAVRHARSAIRRRIATSPETIRVPTETPASVATSNSTSGHEPRPGGAPFAARQSSEEIR